MGEELRARIRFLANEVGITIPDSRVDAWAAELEEGNGRDLSSLWSDVLEFVVGSQKGAVETWVGKQFAEAGNNNPGGDRLSRIADELISGKISFNDKKTQIYEAEGKIPAGGGGNAANPELEKGTPKGESQSQEGVGTPATDDKPGLTILTGKKQTWYYDAGTGKWFVGYGLPGSNREVVFEADPEDMDSLFGEGVRPANFNRIDTKVFLSRIHRTFSGDISEMEGTGSFESEFETVIARAMDDGRLPDWAKGSAEVMDLLFIAQAEDKSADWLIDKIANTKEFTQRFPGLNKLKKEANLSTAEAVTGFLELEGTLRTLQKQSGQSPDKVTPQAVGALLEKGYSAEQITKTYSTFDRMREYKPALDAFNQVLQAQGKAPLTPADQLKFLNGELSQDVYDTYEASAIQENVTGAGLGQFFSAQDAIKASLATAGQLSGQEIAQSVQQAAQLALRFRSEINLGQYGLDPEDLINMSLGIPPQSGQTEAEIRENLDRATQEAQGFLESQSRPFVGFTQEGVAQAQSLGKARQER